MGFSFRREETSLLAGGQGGMGLTSTFTSLLLLGETG